MHESQILNAGKMSTPESLIWLHCRFSKVIAPVFRLKTDINCLNLLQCYINAD